MQATLNQEYPVKEDAARCRHQALMMVNEVGYNA